MWWTTKWRDIKVAGYPDIIVSYVQLETANDVISGQDVKTITGYVVTHSKVDSSSSFPEEKKPRKHTLQWHR